MAAMATTAASAMVKVIAPARLRLLQACRIERRQRGRLLAGRRQIRIAERHQADALERAALAPRLGISRDEFADARLGLHMLALHVDVELARAGVGQVADRL